MSHATEKKDLVPVEAPPRVRPSRIALQNEALKVVGVPVERKTLHAYDPEDHADYDDEHYERTEREIKEDEARVEAQYKILKQKKDRQNRLRAEKSDREERTTEAADSISSAFVEGGFLAGSLKVTAESFFATAAKVGSVAYEAFDTVSGLFGGYMLGRIVRAAESYLRKSERAQNAILVTHWLVGITVVANALRVIGSAFATGGVTLAMDLPTLAAIGLPLLKAGVFGAGYAGGLGFGQMGPGRTVRKVFFLDDGIAIKSAAQQADFRKGAQIAAEIKEIL